MSIYVVTGGCGFIGSHLVDHLVNQGHSVRVIDNLSTGSMDNLNENADFHFGDIIDNSLLERVLKGADGCFHLAAVASVDQSIHQWMKTHRTNLSATINLFDVARKAGIEKVVYASSAAIYGDNTNIPLSEVANKKPTSAYGADKLGCELHAYTAFKNFGLKTVGCRFFNVYGPRQDPNSPYSGVISIFANRILSNKNITIFGDGDQTRDFIYVSDVINHLVAAMLNKNCNAEVFNVCTGKRVSIKNLADMIQTISGNSVDCYFQKERAGDIKHSLGDPKKAIYSLGVKARVDIFDGLIETINNIHLSMVTSTETNNKLYGVSI